MIVGHKNQWDFLVKAAKLERLSHAYLFSGQEHLGKRTLAIEFVKFLNCSSEKGSCQICRNCQDIEKGLHPDFLLIEPESKEIQISQIRNLIQKISFRPYSAVFKVAILDKTHLMTSEAQNCFLKLLEEPKGKALLILISEHSERLLPTILSRVQKLKFYPVKSEEIEKYLVGQKISSEKAKNLAHLSLGRPGVGINFALNPQKVEEQEKLISDLVKISNSDLVSRFQYAKSLSNLETKDPREILNTWLEYFRGLFLSQLGKEETLSQYSLSKLKKIIKLLQSISFLLSTTNINPKLALELLLMEM